MKIMKNLTGDIKRLDFLIVFIMLLFLNIKYELYSKININNNQVLYIDNIKYKLSFKNNHIFVNKINLTDELILDYKIYDINNDNNDEISIITKKNKKDKYGNDLIIFKPYMDNKDIKYKEIYRQNFYDLKPWKINIGNIDNDREADFFIGVYKTTQYYKDLRNRPFFYSWNGERLYKKWTGSYFSENDLVNIIFIDSLKKGYDQVVILEKISDRKYQSYRVSIYMWSGFGFQEIVKSSYLPKIKNIYILDGDISVITENNLIIKLRLSKEKTLNIFKVI